MRMRECSNYLSSLSNKKDIDSGRILFLTFLQIMMDLFGFGLITVGMSFGLILYLKK